MKKFYASLLAVALGVSSVMAFNESPVGERFEAPQKQPVAMSIDQVKSLVKKSAKAKAKVPGKKGVKKAMPANFNGDYVEMYSSIRPETGYEDMVSTEVVNITVEGNEVTLYGFSGWTQEAFDGIDGFVYTAPVKGYIEGDVIKVPYGQVVGSYNGEDIVFYVLDEEGEDNEAGGTLEWDEDLGAFVADFAEIVVGGGYYWGNPGAFPSLVVANGKINYTRTLNNVDTDVDLPVYYELFDDDENGEDDTFMVSAMTPFGEGFVTYWPLAFTTSGRILGHLVADLAKEPEDDPIVNKADVGYAANGRAYSMCMKDKNFYTTEIIIDVTNMEDVVIPAEGYYFGASNTQVDEEGNPIVTTYIDSWEMLDLISHYYLGDFTRAHITPYNQGIVDGIEGVNVDNTNAPAVYYNLQGVRVNNPANGLYIMKQGTKATKVLVK